MARHSEHSLGSEFFIWDLPTRLFHWVLVIGVAVALYTGFLAPASWLGIHLFAGYAIAVLIVFRLVWWKFGFEYSRLAALVAAIRRLPQFLPALIRLKPPHSAGHNPAGSAMIALLIATLSLIVVTGFMVEGGQEKQGVLAGVLDYAAGSTARNLHSLSANLLLGLIAVHLAGVAVETVLQRTPLVRGMISGRLPLPLHVVNPAPRPARPLAAAFILSAIAVAAAPAALALLRLPARGVPSAPLNLAYATECGACHNAFHPSLLPRQSWAAIMAHLGDHFGEDASLSPATAAGIAAYLDRNAAEAWDTEPANRLRSVAAAEPLRITAAPYWIRKHAGIGAATFAAAPIKSKTNCAACHGDATTGRFDDQAIAIPPTQAKGP
ncbi:MAG: cytochrome b/b6 domain-containing protein [Rhizobiales bacterium]|nr:cytochrome b/b6 domain-containing protein [Hyphomicrobiales bacterium]